jgi:hypothetical protein
MQRENKGERRWRNGIVGTWLVLHIYVRECWYFCTYWNTV